MRVLRLAAGYKEEASVEAEAGEQIEAETGARLDAMHEMMRSWIEAHNTAAKA